MGQYDSRIFAAGALGSISGATGTLPAGAELGEERWASGVKYKLFYNAGGASITAGYIASPIPPANLSGPYSVTVTTTSNSMNELGACVAHNATVATAYYFWGAVKGYLASGLVASGTTLATGDCIIMGSDGLVNGVSALSASVSGNKGVGWVPVGPAAGTVAVRQGSVYINLD